MSNNENYREVSCKWGNSIADAVAELQAYHQRGEKVYMEFNGHNLYSDTVTLDSAYLEIMGLTKAEYDKEQEEWREELRKAREEREAQIPELSKVWMEKGHAILDREYWAKWDECVPIRLRDLYRGLELANCLKIVAELNDGCTLEEAKAIIDGQNHSGLSFSLVCSMVSAFCARGEEFVNFVR